MQTNTWLRKQTGWSPLSQQALVRPKGSSTKRVLISSLLLTSLVDAFSILVIFLLMNASTGIETVENSKDVQLPMATTPDAIQEGVVLKLENGGYFLGKTPVALDQLGTALAEEKRKETERSGKDEVALIVQADKKVDYKDLSPILTIGAANGFHQYKLAVLEKSRSAE